MTFMYFIVQAENSVKHNLEIPIEESVKFIFLFFIFNLLIFIWSFHFTEYT